MSIESSDTGPASSAGGSVPERAKDVTNEAGEQAKQVAGDAKEQIREVAADAKEHASDLLDQTRAQARQQADETTKHVASGLHSLSNQIDALGQGRTQEAGSVARYADQARRRLDDLAGRLERGGVDGVAADLSRFARRRPGLFLVSCAGAGFALARLVRAGASGDGNGTSRAPARPPTEVGTTISEFEADPGLPVGVAGTGRA
jgi:vacuolar-type H+-ATPase subunit H